MLSAPPRLIFSKSEEYICASSGEENSSFPGSATNDAISGSRYSTRISPSSAAADSGFEYFIDTEFATTELGFAICRASDLAALFIRRLRSRSTSEVTTFSATPAIDAMRIEYTCRSTAPGSRATRSEASFRNSTFCSSTVRSYLLVTACRR